MYSYKFSVNNIDKVSNTSLESIILLKTVSLSDLNNEFV